MFKVVKYFIFFLAFFFASAVSCSEKDKEIHVSKTECEQIKDVVTDCLGLHRGALGYISSCGDISLVEIKALNSCEEIFNHIENKD
tara:strand:+ start:2182 stop:2439 length:258 start_codon:yes stop_codon:yes gene_type:complete